MSYQYVTCVNFARYKGESGILLSLACKLCGTTIADTVERTIRYERNRLGERVRVTREQFTRFANYTEAKIEFSDSSYHITHGCDKCLSIVGMSPAKLDELHEVDQLESPDGFTARERARSALGVIAIDKKQVGIV